MPGGPGGFLDTAGNPVTITNHLVNFGWEYVYHCHLLAHEEMDMMHGVAFAMTPDAPSNLGAALVGAPGAGVRLTWRDNSANETAFTITRAPAQTGPFSSIAVVQSTTGPGTGGTATYVDTAVVAGTTYYYQVVATNVVGDTMVYVAPAVGFPTMTIDSSPTSVVNITAN
jgi:FtsP/CotA-like multicopper oxidase with cupredoxin domain